MRSSVNKYIHKVQLHVPEILVVVGTTFPQLIPISPTTEPTARRQVSIELRSKALAHPPVAHPPVAHPPLAALAG